MNKFILIFVISLQSCDIKFLGSVQIRKTDERVSYKKAGFQKYEECDEAVTATALQYVAHEDAKDVLLNAAGLKYQHQSLEECLTVLTVTLPSYVETVKMLLLFVSYKHVPIQQKQFDKFGEALLKYFEKEKDDKMINELQVIVKRDFTAPLDFVKAFYDISKLLEAKINDPLFQRIKALGINLLEYPGKTLLKALVLKLKEFQHGKLISQTRYTYRPVFEDWQKQVTPNWIKRFGVQLTKRTIWKISLNRRDCTAVKTFLKRLESCCPNCNISTDEIAQFAVKKFSQDSKNIHAGQHSFPQGLTKKQWNIVFFKLELRNVQEQCLFRAIATCIHDTEKKYKELEEKQLYLQLTNCPPDYSEHTLQREVKNHLIKFGYRGSNIAHVFKLRYEDVGIKDHAIVQFDDEISANNAFQILEMNPLQLGAHTVTVHIP